MKRVRSTSNAESAERKRIRRMPIADVAAEMVAMRERVRALEEELATTRKNSGPLDVGNATGPLGELLDELLVEMFQWFTQPELLTVARVCHAWHSIVNTRLTVLDCEPFILSSSQQCDGFRKYTRIEELSLARNSRADAILSAIPTTHLRSLDLTGTSIVDLDSLRDGRLQTLALGSTFLRGDKLARLPVSITHLTLDWCQNLSIVDMVNLRHLTRLEHLSLSRLGSSSRGVDAFLPVELAPTLRSLKLSNIMFNDRQVRQLHHFRALESLSLERMVGPSFAEWREKQADIAPLEHITHLSLNFFVGSIHSKDIARMFPNLRHFTVGIVQIHDVSALVTMSNLEILDLHHDDEHPGTLQFICEWPKLRRLRLEIPYLCPLEAPHLLALLKKTKLESLHIVDFPHFTAKDLDDLRNEVPQLKSISFARYADGS